MVFAQLLVLLLLARACGALAGRLGQPAMLGEITAGILLGLAAVHLGSEVPFLAALPDSPVPAAAAELGIFFLVLLAGVELQPKEIAEGSGASLAVALGGLVLPLAGGMALAWVFLPDNDLHLPLALLTGVALSITALPVTVHVLTGLGALHGRVGRTIVGAALFDDVMGLFLTAVLLAVIAEGQAPGVVTLLLLLAKVGLFFGVTIAAGVHVYPRVRRGLRLTQATALEFTALAVAALAWGLLAELLDLHWILGAFMAGLYFEKSRVGVRAWTEMRLILNVVVTGFLGPLFFASIGLRVDPAAVFEVPVFLALLLLVAFAGKLLGAGLPALATGFDRRQSLAIGVGMSSRGAVELVVLSIAEQAGLFRLAGDSDPVTANLFSAIVLTAIVTTLATPPVLRRILRPTGQGSPAPGD